MHEITVITEREKYVVPIHAIGPRAILDFPDEISFQTCPVRYATRKTLLVRNIGNRDANFALEVAPYAVKFNFKEINKVQHKPFLQI